MACREDAIEDAHNFKFLIINCNIEEDCRKFMEKIKAVRPYLKKLEAYFNFPTLYIWPSLMTCFDQ